MKVLVAAIAFMSMSVMSFAQEMTADQVIDAYLEVSGGKEAWRELKGQRAVGEFTIQETSFPFEMWEMADGRSATVAEVMGMQFYQGCFDGENLWNTNQMTMKAELADSEETENKKRESQDFPNAYLDYNDKGYTIELIGKETVDGVECYKIMITKGTELVDGEEKPKVQYDYFDAETFAHLRSEMTMSSGPAAGTVITTTLSDYQEVDGLYFPFSIETSYGEMGSQTIELEEIELNPEVEDEIFAFPG